MIDTGLDYWPIFWHVLFVMLAYFTCIAGIGILKRAEDGVDTLCGVLALLGGIVSIAMVVASAATP